MYKKIKISFIHAGSIEFDTEQWTDFEMTKIGDNGFVVIKDGETWIACYNLKEVFSVVLEK